MDLLSRLWTPGTSFVFFKTYKNYARFDALSSTVWTPSSEIVSTFIVLSEISNTFALWYYLIDFIIKMILFSDVKKRFETLQNLKQVYKSVPMLKWTSTNKNKIMCC